MWFEYVTSTSLYWHPPSIQHFPTLYFAWSCIFNDVIVERTKAFLLLWFIIANGSPVFWRISKLISNKLVRKMKNVIFTVRLVSFLPYILCVCAWKITDDSHVKIILQYSTTVLVLYCSLMLSSDKYRASYFYFYSIYFVSTPSTFQPLDWRCRFC